MDTDILLFLQYKFYQAGDLVWDQNILHHNFLEDPARLYR
jgi:hypothetical protein